MDLGHPENPSGQPPVIPKRDGIQLDTFSATLEPTSEEGETCSFDEAVPAPCMVLIRNCVG